VTKKSTDAKLQAQARTRTRWVNLLFGRRLASGEASDQQIGPWAGIPLLGLDALASSAYGPEAALTILIPLGAAGLGQIGPITLAIVIILILVAFSYRQTIGAYPNGGGSYTVAKENLGHHLGLLAAAALMVDYVLNVAVATSAGVAAVGSAFPPLLKYTLPLCLALVAVLTVVNLRGVREAGFAFMAPTYLFVACMFCILTIGCIKSITNGGHPSPVVPPPNLPAPRETLTLWLVVRAFANGCTAMTGVEAVSNAVPIFREPKVKWARLTLTAIIILLAVMLGGIAYLCRTYGIGATEPGSPNYQSVLSELTGAVAGRGWFYYLSMASIFSVLCLSANTSFADFPRVCRLMALDHYLPEAFAVRGRRLVYSFGIWLLAGFATILLLVFRGITNGLIPLFAIGALLSFTLSQAGMVAHWRQRLRDAHAKFALCINATGAAATGLTVLIVMVSKFTEGAWITLLLLPAITLILLHLQKRARQMEADVESHRPLDLHWPDAPIMVVPISDWTRVAEKALLFAMRLSPEVHVLEVLTGDVPKQDLSQEWHDLVEVPTNNAGLKPPILKVIRSRYRQQLRPIVTYVQEVARQNPGRVVAVVVPELVEQRWYHYFLGAAILLRGLLLLRGNPRVVVMTVPWYARAKRRKWVPKHA